MPDGNIVTNNPATVATVIAMLISALTAFLTGKVRSGHAEDKRLLDLRTDFQDRLKELRTDFDKRVEELRKEYEKQVMACQALTAYERDRAERMTQVVMEGLRTMQELQQQIKRQSR